MNKKPDWKNAPVWAKYLAIDNDGNWIWFQKKPEWSATGIRWMTGDQMWCYDSQAHIVNTLEKRPKNDK